MRRLTPILFVDAIEPALPFWIERLGFSVLAEVPHGDRLGFALLERDGIQVMYQTWSSMEDDIPGLFPRSAAATSALYIDVQSLDALLPKLAGADVVVPERTTFYGAREIFVREPGGHVVGFAEHTQR